MTTDHAMPIWPAVIDPADMLLGYNPFADELVLIFGDADRPHYAEPLDASSHAYLSLLLDPSSDEVVGVMVEHARLSAIANHPEWVSILDAAPSDPILRHAHFHLWPALAKFVADVQSLARQQAVSR
jgi:hypothetical protein